MGAVDRFDSLLASYVFGVRVGSMRATGGDEGLRYNPQWWFPLLEWVINSELCCS